MTPMIDPFTVKELLNVYFISFMSFVCSALIFTALEKFPNLKCVKQAPWWCNNSINIDILYVIINPVFKISLRLLPVAVIILPMLTFMEPMQIYTYLINANGPFGRLSPFTQGVIFIIFSDFLSYWNHRIFHQKNLWPFHAIHHGPHDVDWTTAYRFHPLNLAFGSWLVASIPVVMGVSPINIIPATLIEAIMAYFVHSNLNFTFGSLRYFVATPVFHRWHHTHSVGGEGANYGAIFSFWDVIFGTFYFPDTLLPMTYGIKDCEIEEKYLSQIIYPFKIFYLNIYRHFNR